MLLPGQGGCQPPPWLSVLAHYIDSLCALGLHHGILIVHALSGLLAPLAAPPSPRPHTPASTTCTHPWHLRHTAQALSELAPLAGAALVPHAAPLASLLIAESAGRLWDGKQAVPTALAAVAAAPGCLESLVAVDASGE